MDKCLSGHHPGLHIPRVGPNRLLRECAHADGSAVEEAAQVLAKAQRYNQAVAAGFVKYML